MAMDSRPTKKYLVIPGCVKSQHDNDIHYISGLRLCELYGVSPTECIIVSDSNDLKIRYIPKDLPMLTTRQDGNYSLPKTF